MRMASLARAGIAIDHEKVFSSHIASGRVYVYLRSADLDQFSMMKLVIERLRFGQFPELLDAHRSGGGSRDASETNSIERACGYG
jgi:hypothetical protein